MKKFNFRLNLRAKLIGIFILVSFFPVIILGIMSYYLAEKTVREKVYENVYNTANQISYSLQTVTERIENTMDYIFTDNKLQAILNSGFGDADTPSYKEMNKLLDVYFINTDNLITCSVISSSGARYYYKRSINDRKFEELCYVAAIDAGGSTIWNGRVSLEELWPWTDSAIVTSRSIKNLAENDVVTSLGVVTMFFSERIFSESYRYAGSDVEVYLTDEHGEIISSNQSDEVLIDAAQNLAISLAGNEPESPEDIIFNNEKYVLASSKVGNSGWMVFELVPYTTISGNFLYIKIFSFVVTIINLVGILLLSFFFSQKITSPLYALNNEMKKVSGGNFDVVVFSSDRNDEIGEIQHGFNYMVDRMKLLFKTTIDKEKENQLEVIKALQYQINPHFLYNTLNSIRLRALMSNSNNIVSMIDSLITMLRNLSGKTGELVTIREEIETAVNFLRIHQIRYQNDIILENKINNDLQTLLIPNFILQPIIENSLFHAFDEETTNGRIEISAILHNDRLTIMITDNGRGMTTEEIKNIFENNKAVSDTLVKIGIVNVDKRLKLMFGEEFGIEVSSTPGNGTTVKINTPIINKEVDK